MTDRVILHLTVDVTPSGTVFVTSPDPRGLIVSGRTLRKALAGVADAIEDMRTAGRAFPQFEGVRLK